MTELMGATSVAKCQIECCIVYSPWGSNFSRTARHEVTLKSNCRAGTCSHQGGEVLTPRIRAPGEDGTRLLCVAVPRAPREPRERACPRGAHQVLVHHWFGVRRRHRHRRRHREQPDTPQPASGPCGTLVKPARNAAPRVQPLRRVQEAPRPDL